LESKIADLERARKMGVIIWGALTFFVSAAASIVTVSILAANELAIWKSIKESHQYKGETSLAYGHEGLKDEVMKIVDNLYVGYGADVVLRLKELQDVALSYNREVKDPHTGNPVIGLGGFAPGGRQGNQTWTVLRVGER
jgi:hypothetical protein